MSKVVLTYGTFDLFHIGHLSLLSRLKKLGGRLVVGVSTDMFNAEKGKRTFIRYEDRAEIVRGLKCVDEVFAEESWDQKVLDIARFDASILGMGSDWAGRFDHLSDACEVVYLPRTESVSSTDLKKILNVLDQQHVRELKDALDLISSVVRQFE